MPAWVEDAQQLTELRDLSGSQSSVLLRTTEVEEFLSNLTLSSHALVAPKGFGKTLVLKLKRISLQENDYRCFPFSPIVDRPSNKPPILPNEIINVLESSDNWETLWNIAFSICLIKGFQDDRDVHQQLEELLESKDLPPTLLNILTHPHITRPFDILHDCLAAQRNEIFAIMRAAQQVTRIFATIHKQAGIFVDNIDEYLIHYIIFPICAETKSTNDLSASGTRARSAHGSLYAGCMGSIPMCEYSSRSERRPISTPRRTNLSSRISGHSEESCATGSRI
jgi:hypothetical protein